MRILITKNSRGRMTVVKVDGWLKAEHLGALWVECESAGYPLVLDLSELRWADRYSLEALRALRDSGATFLNLSPYLELVLEQASEAK